MGQNSKQQPRSPVMPNNLGKINIGNNQPKIGQSSDRGMFGSNNFQPQNQPEQHQMGRAVTSGQINGPKAMFDSRMDIEGIGMTTSQVVNRQNNNFVQNNNPNNYQNYQNYSSVSTNNQQFQQAGNQNFRQDNYQQNNQFQNRLQQQNLQQQPQHLQQQPQQFQQPISSSRQAPV